MLESTSLYPFSTLHRVGNFIGNVVLQKTDGQHDHDPWNAEMLLVLMTDRDLTTVSRTSFVVDVSTRYAPYLFQLFIETNSAVNLV